MTTEYEVKDHSLLVPHFKRWLWGPLVERIPARISANTLTLSGTLLSGAAFAVTALLPASRTTCAIAAALIFAYLTLDNIDGAHARRTQTSSPLGEFLDHWLDALNLSFLFAGAIYTWSIPAPRAVVIMMLAVLSYTLTFWEQRVTGRIHMAMLGNVEGIVTVVLFYLAGVLFGPEALIQRPVVFGLTIIDLFWLSAVANTSITSLSVVLRVRQRWLELFELLWPVLLVGAWYLLGQIAALPACHLLMLLTPALAGRMLIARTTGREGLRPDRLLLAAITAGCLLSLAVPLSEGLQAGLLAVILLYAITSVTLDFVLTLRRLAGYLRPGELLSIARFGA